MEVRTIRIVNKSKYDLPEYQTSGSAGVDLRANIDDPMILRPGDRTIIPTGLYVAIPEGYEMQVRPRSGLAAKHGITVLNAPGTIDSDYRGEICVILYNSDTTQPYTIQPGERIAQAVIAQYVFAQWTECDSLEETMRVGGFGSTGVK